MDFIDYIKQHPFYSELNPFSRKFDKNFVDKRLSENAFNEDDFLSYILIGNEQYKALYGYLESLKTQQQFPFYFILAITLINHDYMEISKIMEKQLANIQKENSGIKTSLDYQKVKLQTSLSDYSLMPFSDALTETLDLLFSFFRNINEVPQKIAPLTDTFFLNNDTFYKLHFFSEYFALLKDIYEKVSYEKMTVEKVDDSFYMKDLYNGYTLYRQLGFHRIDQNIKMNMHRMLQYPLKDYFMGKYEIDKIYLNKNDVINITYKQKTEKNLYLETYLKTFLSAIYTYHFHLSKEFKDSLIFTAEIWTVLIYITTEFLEQTAVVFNEFNDGIITYSKYQFKIRSKDIVKTIEKLTGYDKSIILEKLKLFENNGYKSFWARPLFKIEDWIYISIHSLHSTMPVFLIDEWVKLSFPKTYDKKGTMFEDFLKTEINCLCKNKNFFSNILEQKKYLYKDETGKKYSEEIDFIWETKNCIVIAEVKCIDYPFTSRITNNHFQVLEKAANQIKRKKDFFENNKNLFSIKNLNKKILPCIIINYPCFSGLKIDGIPVIDIGLLDNYLSVGGLGNLSLGIYEESISIREKYYNNEDEFSINLEKLVNDSPYLNQLQTHYKKIVKNLKISDKFSIKYDAYENIEYEPGADK